MRSGRWFRARSTRRNCRLCTLGHWGRALLPKDLHLRGAFVAPPNGASYVVITPAAWVGAAEQFAALHAAEGLSTAVVSIESLYDAYGNSVATPHAILAAW